MHKKALRKIIATAAIMAFVSEAIAPAGTFLTFALEKTPDGGFVLYKPKSAQAIDNFNTNNNTKKYTALFEEKGSEKTGGINLFQKNIFAKPAYAPGEVLVKFKKGKLDLKQFSAKEKVREFAAKENLDKKREVLESNIVVLRHDASEPIESAVERLKSDPSVEYAQPNYLYEPLVIETNDIYKDKLWALYNEGQEVNGISGTADADIDIPEAWGISEGGGSEAIVAVIDTGIAYNHPDLISNMWDGSDCLDENGVYLGGCEHGYDYEEGDKNPLPKNSSEYIYYSHGTYIAGAIGAEKNNEKGIIGVAPKVKLMALKTKLYTDQLINSINFAQQNGAKIINASWGGNYFDYVLYSAIRDFPGLFIAGAGNDASNNDEEIHFYPSDYDLENIISVAATDQNDNLAVFSNYGAISVDVGAPGVNIYTTSAGEYSDGSDEVYDFTNGTSLATPHIAGLAALIWGYKPDLSISQVKDLILNTGDALPTLEGKTASGKRINAYNALSVSQEPIEPLSITVDKLKIDDTTPQITGSVSDDEAAIKVTVNSVTYNAINYGGGFWFLPDNTISELNIGIYDVKAIATKYFSATDNTKNELVITYNGGNPPLAAAIDNQKFARPVSGVNEADVVYEFPVEGSITRFMVIYDPDSAVNPETKIGPVRSARPYFARAASEHKAIYAHAGGIPETLNNLRNHTYGVYNLDALTGDGEKYFWRDEYKSAPHNLYTSIGKLNLFREKFNLGSGTFNKPWVFSDNPSSLENIGFDKTEVEVKYADMNYNVKWIYNDEDGIYYRKTYENGNYEDYLDANGKQVSTANLAVQYAYTDPFAEISETQGIALLCREGRCAYGSWKKSGANANVKFYLGNEEFEFKTGKLWINVAEDLMPPEPIANVKIENASSEDELKLKISWTNPQDKDLVKIIICRSNIYNIDTWKCDLASYLKEVPGNSIESDYIAPNSTNVIDNYKLAEGVVYYYRLYSIDASGNFSDWSEEASGSPSYVDLPSSGIKIDDIVWIRNFGATSDTYIDGWKVKFDITVNNPEENQLRFKLSDWISGSKTIATFGNTKISLVDFGDESEISSAENAGTEYNDMNPLAISDKNPAASGTQTGFYVWIKLPRNSSSGSYSASYGIKALSE